MTHVWRHFRMEAGKQHSSYLRLVEGGRCVDEGSLRSDESSHGCRLLVSGLGDDFDIVGGVETDPAVLAAFAPALFVFIL